MYIDALESTSHLLLHREIHIFGLVKNTFEPCRQAAMTVEGKRLVGNNVILLKTVKKSILKPILTNFETIKKRIVRNIAILFKSVKNTFENRLEATGRKHSHPKSFHPLHF